MEDTSCVLMKMDPKNWLHIDECTGSTFIHSGEDLEQQQEAIMILAKNGDIHLKATNGKDQIRGT